jgi:hypothetical protein
VNTANTVNGMASNKVGSSATRATNHDCSRNSRQANGRRGMSVSVSHDNRKNSPSERSGVDAPAESAISPPFARRIGGPHTRSWT